MLPLSCVGVEVIPRNFLAEPRSTGNERVRATSVDKLPAEDRAAVYVAAATAALASAAEVEATSVPLRRPDDDYTSQASFSALSAPAALYRGAETTVTASCTSNPPSALTSIGE